MSSSSKNSTIFAHHCFSLPQSFKTYLKSKKPTFGFNGFGETVYYRTYSRLKEDGTQESWTDTVIRVVEGVFSIRKSYYIQHGLDTNRKYLSNEYACKFAEALFNMEFLPPGRGLWSMGSNFVYTRGSSSLFNCGYREMKDLVKGVTWTFDMLMCGVGIGFDTQWNEKIKMPDKEDKFLFVIPDSREGWTDSVRLLLEAYIDKDFEPDLGDNTSKSKYSIMTSEGEVNENNRGKFPIFDFSQIRKAGEPIRGFGGTASGPESLIVLLKRIEVFLDTLYLTENDPENYRTYYLQHLSRLKDDYCYNAAIEFYNNNPDKLKPYNRIRCVADIINSVGICVVSGSVRRSAEIAFGKPDDETFLNLKNYNNVPERASIGWMSNNSCRFEKSNDFDLIPDIIERVKLNGEPGFGNILNFKHGRIGSYHKPGDPYTREYEMDTATGGNPCFEILLNDAELCNLAEVFPTRCDKNNFSESFYQAIEFATFYASTVTLLPTHSYESNAIICKNRRIGISLSGLADWYSELKSETQFIRYLRDGYKHIRKINKMLADEAGINESIRVTTVKPSGTISLMAGVSPGLHYPTFKYALRRMRAGKYTKISQFLIDSGLEYEIDKYSSDTYVFEFPIKHICEREAKQVSIWEQFSMLCSLQRHWSDNSCSITIYYDKSEENQLCAVVSQNIANIKSCSLLPHTDEGVYAQSPYERLLPEEYQKRVKNIKPINWNKFTGSDGVLEKYCNNDVCEL